MNSNKNVNAKERNYCTIYIILFVIILIISSVFISSVFIYFYWYFKKDNIRVKFNTNTEITIYQIHINGKHQRNKH